MKTFIFSIETEAVSRPYDGATAQAAVVRKGRRYAFGLTPETVAP
jgi:hypothetical protein